MSIRAKYENALNCVFNKLIAMCRDTELAIEKSVNALKQRDRELAKEVISEDATSVPKYALPLPLTFAVKTGDSIFSVTISKV